MSETYQYLLNKLLSVNVAGGMKLGLKNCQELDMLLGYPSQAFPAVHIAGTNGKGSVSTKIAAGYETDGMKVGLFTSPHVACFRERIRINGKMISENQTAGHLKTLFLLCDRHDIKATFFELTTLLAFVHFREETVDIAVLETGLGGRLDATNIANTILSVITSISLDHTEILGETVEAIAKEKAGIIKENIPVIIGPAVPKSILIPLALQKNSPCIRVQGEFEDFHQENCAIAQEAMTSLRLSWWAIENGLKALPCCRMETYSKAMLENMNIKLPLPEAVILDVAHNPDGLEQLLKALRKRYRAPLRFLIGMSCNKDVTSCLGVIKDEACWFHLVEGSNERAVAKEQLAEELIALGVNRERIICEDSISSGIANGIHLGGINNEVVVVCGTFFIMAEARKALGIVETHDPVDMNER